MQYKAVNNTYFVTLAPGEEIVSSLENFCRETGVKLASVSAIGAVNEIEIGLFHPAEKRYEKETLKRDFEITALLGNITQKDGEPYLHLHITVADESRHAFGGHLNRAVVSAACEIIVQSFVGEVGRVFNEKIGLNIWKF